MRAEKKINKLYSKSFEYGKKEHKYERITTIILFIGFVIGLKGFIYYFDILSFILFLIITVALWFRVKAGWYHRKEKKMHTKINRIKKFIFRD